jgi:hypothetical protein
VFRTGFENHFPANFCLAKCTFSHKKVPTKLVIIINYLGVSRGLFRGAFQLPAAKFRGVQLLATVPPFRGEFLLVGSNCGQLLSKVFQAQFSLLGSRLGTLKVWTKRGLFANFFSSFLLKNSIFDFSFVLILIKEERSVTGTDPGLGSVAFLAPGSGIRSGFFRITDHGSRISDPKPLFLRA